MRGLFLRSNGLKLHLWLAVGAFTLAVLTTSASASTIWIGDAPGGAVEKFDASGAPLGLAAIAPFPIGGMTTVGGEIWIGAAFGIFVDKFDASGAPLGPAGVVFPFLIGGMTTVGGEIWIGDANTGLVDKFDASGAPLGPATFAAFDIGGMTTVPIPGTIWLFGSALGLLGWSRRKAA